jgi:hypothetical protein
MPVSLFLRLLIPTKSSLSAISLVEQVRVCLTIPWKSRIAESCRDRSSVEFLMVLRLSMDTLFFQRLSLALRSH